jgi:hypothetical protein
MIASVFEQLNVLLTDYTKERNIQFRELQIN